MRTTIRRHRLAFIEPESQDGAGPIEPSESESGEESAEPDSDEDGTEGPEEDEDEGEFDKERALAKSRKVNSENRNLRKENKRLKEATPEGQGTPQGAEQEDGPTREELLAENTRLKVLSDNGIPAKYLKFITAAEPDAVLEQIQELLELGGSSKPAPNPRPTPVLKGGARPHHEPEETDPRKLAAAVPRM